MGAGLGVWTYNSSQAEESVSKGLAQGVRSFDTAQTYANQDGVGAAVRKSGVPRKDIFLTTKVDGGLGEDGTVQAHKNNLNALGMDYVDLLLVHFPCDWDKKLRNKAERQASWRGLETLHKEGLARAIGVSHYCQNQIQDILEINTVPIALNQQEWHVGMGPDPEGVKSFCDKHNITYMSFSPLCGPCGTAELFNGTLVTTIGAKHNKTGPQIALKWLVDQGSPVIPRTLNPKHMAEDMNLFNWELSKDAKSKLDAATSPASVETVAADCKITVVV